MAQKFLSKALTLFTAISHDVLDSAIDANAVPVVRQYIRDLEELEMDMVDEAAEANAAAAQSEQEIRSLTTAQAGHLAAAEQFVNDKLTENDDDAQAHALEAVRIGDLIESQKEGAATLRQVADKYSEVQKGIAGKKAALTVKLRQLTITASNVKANERAIDKLDELQGVLDATTGNGVDNVGSRLDAQAAASRAKLDARLNRVSSATPLDPNAGRAAALLASLRKGAQPAAK